MTLQYRSKRRGFHFYVQGQTKEVARKMFDLKVQMKLLKQEVLFDTVICTYSLEFDHYDQVPANLEPKVIEDAKRAKEEE